MDLCLFSFSVSLPSPGWFGNLCSLSWPRTHGIPPASASGISTKYYTDAKDVTNPLEIHTMKALVTKEKLRQTHTQWGMEIPMPYHRTKNTVFKIIYTDKTQ